MQKILLKVWFVVIVVSAYAQPSAIKAIFPEGTVFHQNIPYANDTLKKHLLDLYLPPQANANTPLVIFIHGGGWMVNDKYADMNYMKNTVNTF